MKATSTASRRAFGCLALRNSVVAENTVHGVSLQTGAGQVLDAALDNVMLSNNDSNGLNVAGSNITVAVSSSTVVGNITGVSCRAEGAPLRRGSPTT
jgi:hypothetical protein